MPELHNEKTMAVDDDASHKDNGAMDVALAVKKIKTCLWSSALVC